MSVTKNGSRSGTFDFFRTPHYCVRALEPQLRAAIDAGFAFLDAGAGYGDIAETLLEMGARHVTAVELDPVKIPILRKLAEKYPGRLDVIEHDFLTWEPSPLWGSAGARVCVMNSPFKTFDGRDGIQAFVEKCLALQIRQTFALARWNWLAPAGKGGVRMRWNRAHPAHGHILTRRPAFIALTKKCSCGWRGVAARETKSIVHEQHWTKATKKEPSKPVPCDKIGTPFKSADQADACEYAWLEYNGASTASYSWLECPREKRAAATVPAVMTDTAAPAADETAA